MQKGILQKLILSILAILMFSGCAVTSEEYRYKQRFDAYYKLLNENEKANFRAYKMKEVGKSIDVREANDAKLKANMYDVRIAEAITSFDGEEMTKFFYEIILRELNRTSFYKLMDFFNSAEQLNFVYQNRDFIANFNSKYSKDKKFKRFVDSLKKEYKLYDFSTEEIMSFFRNVSFVEVSRKQVYSLFKFLKKIKLLSKADNGDFKTIAIELDKRFAKMASVSLKEEFLQIKNLSGMNNVESTELFLKAYYEVVLKEMDGNALAKTRAKF